MSTGETDIVCDRENDKAPEVYRLADEGTQFQNRREKKRVQNRLAQRTYRQRLKAKLDGLQEKVKAHEQQLEISTRAQSYDSTAASTTAATIVDSMCPTLATRQDPAIRADSFLGDNSDGCPAGIEFVNQTAFLYSDDPTVTVSSAEPSGTQNTPHASPDSQASAAPAVSRSAVDVPANYAWQDAFCSPRGLHDPITNAEAQQDLAGYFADVPQIDVQLNVDASAPVHDRIRYIIDQVEALGFGTFEEAVATYYTEMFEDTSPLCQDQRLSRNRRLPQLLSALQNAAKDWSEWERRGFQEQITQGAEEILAEELDSFIARSTSSAASEEAANHELEGGRLRSRGDPKRSRRVQDDLPNLWALATALLTKTNPLKKDSLPNTVLEVIEALCFGSRANLDDRP